MRSAYMVLMVVVLTWVMAAEAIFPLAAIAAFVGSRIASIAVPLAIERGKRSVNLVSSDDEKNILLSVMTQLDPDGCILKLLCSLEASSTEGVHTPKERALVNTFTNQNETLTPYNAAYIYAVNIGQHAHDAALCDKKFNKCSISVAELRDLLEWSSNCGEQ
ncbi:uncharacterized protein LOC121872212 isoform X1 [Homarus americanus]|nr:uncharacterized protein LOC121872212 isoform X1 [Homarus americanus]